MQGNFWKHLAHRLGSYGECLLDLLRHRTRQKPHPDIPMQIIAYRGFGIRQAETWRGQLTGRVLRPRKAFRATQSTRWNNLRASYARFGTREVPGVGVTGNAGGITAQAITDEEGYFRLDFRSAQSVSDVQSIPVTITLPSYSQLKVTGDPLITLPGGDAQFGVISDVDDTLLQTQATSLYQMMRLTLFESAASRLAFAGVAEFYQALHAGSNPFFYVSSSPWNLYEFLVDFMRLNYLVPGPLMLRDFGIDETKFIAGSHAEHKLLQIRSILSRYPNLSFILSGDSGQDDPHIYAAIANEFPEQVCAIYIRDVGNERKQLSVQRLVEELQQRGIDMLLVPDSLAAATHAASKGLLPESALQSIEKAVANNHQARQE